MGLGESGATSVVANGYVYEIGGVANPNAVEFAAINADGTLGTWNATTALPVGQGESGATSVVANGYIYEIGGDNPSNSTLVQYAPINADGTLGAWQTSTSSLPTGESGATSVVANGYVYEIGGNNPSNSTLVQYASLGAVPRSMAALSQITTPEPAPTLEFM